MEELLTCVDAQQDGVVTQVLWKLAFRHARAASLAAAIVHVLADFVIPRGPFCSCWPTGSCIRS
jgi:hypothetical protein